MNLKKGTGNGLQANLQNILAGQKGSQIIPEVWSIMLILILIQETGAMLPMTNLIQCWLNLFLIILQMDPAFWVVGKWVLLRGLCELGLSPLAVIGGQYQPMMYKQELVILTICMFSMRRVFIMIMVKRPGQNGGRAWILKGVELLSFRMMDLVIQQVTYSMKKPEL